MENKESVYFGAGCFWGVEAILKRQVGVLKTEVGYLGGNLDEPTYRQICTGETGHAEVVLVEFNPSEISFKKLMDLFLRLHDPTQLNRQGVDIGTQYRSGVYFTSEVQEKEAKEVLKDFDKENSFGKPSVTEVVAATKFWIGEDYHQDYFDKNPGHLCHTLRENW
ncbi:MAG: peptide-methionine (S)-S-oxide reductase MsrA [Bdellovibrionales bacterium]